MMEIRLVDVSELGTLMTWRMIVLREVFDVPANDPMTALKAQNEAYYARHLADGSHIACFAVDEGEIVGCGGVCLYDEMPSPDNPNGRCAYLMNIYVLPSRRKKGTGRQIVSWLVEQAKKRDVQKIYLEASKPAIPLYESMGFEPMVDFFHLP
ncbi:GNAT family N-acetyltransferase [Dubosiella muris]|nr:GNAT family N-acetyltransferase [Dubosiella muris]